MPPLPGRSESVRDTASNLDRPTVKGPASAPTRQFTSGHSDPKIADKKELKVAKPLEESRTSQFIIQADDPPALARLRGRRTLTEQQIEAYRARRKGTPIWLWATLALGAVVVLILLISLGIRG